ncbi:MAG: divergent PAP2 family protein [Oscillospiraceae bacterium]|nr:divergent PAP2 family protein [Oscillospiraceae bacterium]
MSEVFTGIINNYIIQVAALSWLTAQVLKTIINMAITKQFKAERLVGAGGMPSSHTALVVSAAIATAKQCGTSSPEFALAAMFAAVVMYDAMGVRYAAGEQAKVINQLVDEWLDTVKFDQEKIPHFKELKEMLGHTPIEVIGGIIVGVVISLII